ncbi:MAG: hypothetical protein QXE84_09225 [Candidatus Nitrosotenuis sp.]
MIVQDAFAKEFDLDSIGFERISETVSIIDADAFTYDFQGRYGIYTSNMVQKSFLEAGKIYYVIHKVKPKPTDFPNNTQSATVGYAFHPGVVPPEEFIETSTIGDSYKFTMDPQKSFFVRFSVSIDEVRKYSYQFHQNFYQNDTMIGGSEGTGPFTVVGKYSNAIGEDGRCKVNDFTLVIKHDYSTIVCTTKETKTKLQNRGWALE